MEDSTSSFQYKTPTATYIISLSIVCSRCGKKLGEYSGEIFYAMQILCRECYAIEGIRQ